MEEMAGTLDMAYFGTGNGRWEAVLPFFLLEEKRSLIPICFLLTRVEM